MYTNAQLSKLAPNVQKRIRIEQKVIRKLIDIVLEREYVISVYDGEEWVLHRSASKKAICAAMMSTDEDMWRIGKPSGDRIGKVWFIYGNEGYDVVHDYSYTVDCNGKSVGPMGEIMDELKKYTDKLESGAA